MAFSAGPCWWIGVCHIDKEAKRFQIMGGVCPKGWKSENSGNSEKFSVLRDTMTWMERGWAGV